MNSVFWRRKISYILKEKCGEVGARRGECSDKLFYMIGLGKSRGMSGVPPIFKSLGGHRDPFDRMLIAQAQSGNFPIVSNERIFDEYHVRRIW